MMANEKKVLKLYADRKGSDQAAHLCSLFRAFPFI